MDIMKCWGLDIYLENFLSTEYMLGLLNNHDISLLVYVILCHIRVCMLLK